MPPVRRANIGRRTCNANRLQSFLRNKTYERHIQHLEASQIRISQAQSIKTTEQQIQSSSTRSVIDNAQNNLVHQQNRQPNMTIRNEHLAFRYDPTVDYTTDISVNFGTMSIVCQYCSALRFRHEPPGLCCANGKVKLPQLTPLPEPLASLLSGQGPQSKHFLQNI